MVLILPLIYGSSLFHFIFLIIISLRVKFSQQPQLVVFHCSLSDSKSLQVSRTLLSILADLNNVMVWMVPFLLMISNSSIFFSKPLGTIPSASTTNGITSIVMLYGFFSSLDRFKYVSILFFFFFSVSGPPERHNPQDFLFSRQSTQGPVFWQGLDVPLLF